MKRIMMHQWHAHYALSEQRLLRFAEAYDNENAPHVVNEDKHDELVDYFKGVLEDGGKTEELKKVITDRLEGDGLLDAFELIFLRNTINDVMKELDRVQENFDFEDEADRESWNEVMAELPTTNDQFLKFVVDQNLLTPTEITQATIANNARNRLLFSHENPTLNDIAGMLTTPEAVARTRQIFQPAHAEMRKRNPSSTVLRELDSYVHSVALSNGVSQDALNDIAPKNARELSAFIQMVLSQGVHVQPVRRVRAPSRPSIPREQQILHKDGMVYFGDGRPSKTMAEYIAEKKAKIAEAQGPINMITGKPITPEDMRWAKAMRGPRGDIGRHYEDIERTAAKHGFTIDRDRSRSASRLPSYQVWTNPSLPGEKYAARKRAEKYVKESNEKEDKEIAKRDEELQKNMPKNVSAQKVTWLPGADVMEDGIVVGRYVYFKGKDGQNHGVVMKKGEDGIERVASNVYPFGALVSVMKKAVSPDHIHELEKVGFSADEVEKLKDCFHTDIPSPRDYMQPSILELAEKYSFAVKVLGVLKTTRNTKEIEKKIAAVSEKLTYCSQPAKEQVLQKLFENRGWNTQNISHFVRDPRNPLNSLFS